MVLTWEFVEEYVNHVKVNQHLNPQVSKDAKIGINEAVDFLFDVPATIDEAGILGFLVLELSLFQRLVIPTKKKVAPLEW